MSATCNPDRKKCFFANSVYSSGKTLRSDLDNVSFYLNNAEFDCHKSAKRRFLVRKIVNLFCMQCGSAKR